MVRSRRLLLLLALLLAGGVALFLAVRHGGVVELLREITDQLRAAGPLPYFVAMALLPACGVPTSFFVFPAAAAFEPQLGLGGVIACSILALLVNMTLSYGLAAKVLHPLLERFILWLGYRVPKLPADSTWQAILLVRLIPGPPYVLQNTLLGLARVPFGPYLVVSGLVTSLYTTLTILAVTGVTRGNPVMLVGAVLALVLVVIGARQLRRRLRRKGEGTRDKYQEGET